MSDNIVHLNDRRPVTINDGGKARIRARRGLIGLAKQGGPIAQSDSLVMLRADVTEAPCDCA